MAERDLQALFQRLIESLDRGSRAYDWAVEIAAEINRTIPCEACAGTGYRERHKTCHHDPQSRYVLGCYDKFDCKKCRGFRRVYSAKAGEINA